MRMFFKYALKKECVHRSIMLSLVGGTIYVFVNQYDAILHGPFTKTNLMQISITYCVPYLVSTYSSSMQARYDEMERRK